MAITMTLDELHIECKKCQKCRLRATCTQVVPGEGNPQAEILFIGEGPGQNEDKQGRPFCGAAGRLLDEMISSIGLKREEVFIANMIKCRPPENRDPLPDELDACSPWLDQQIEIMKPKVIVTLGRFSMAKMLPGTRISEVHGKVFKNPPFIVIPLYHPAVGLYKASMKETLLQDFKSIKLYLSGELVLESLRTEITEIRALLDKNEKPEENADKQISLF